VTLRSRVSVNPNGSKRNRWELKAEVGSKKYTTTVKKKALGGVSKRVWKKPTAHSKKKKKGPIKTFGKTEMTPESGS